MKKLARFSFVALIFPAILFSQGSGPAPGDLPKLVQQATLIADATVQSITPSARGQIQTQDVIFSVNSVFKGTAPPADKLLLSHLAGGRGPATIPMKVGERYILFLRPLGANAIAAGLLPVQNGVTQYSNVGRDNAVKIDAEKIIVSPEMPFHDSYDGRSREEFLRELQKLIKSSN